MNNILKKGLFIFVTIILLVTTMTSALATLEDDFERTVASGWGTATNGNSWTVDGDATSSVTGGIGVLKGDATTTSTEHAILTLDSTGNTRIDFDIKWDDFGTSGEYITVYDASSSYAIYIRDDGSGNLRTHNGASLVAFSEGEFTPVDGEWYRISIREVSSTLYDIYIDDVLVGNDETKYGSSVSWDKIEFATRMNAKFYINNICTSDCEPTLNDAILYYSFDTNSATTVTDLSSSKDNGTVNGASWGNTISVLGGSYYFDGINDDITATINVDVNDIKTIAFWNYFPVFAGTTISLGTSETTGNLMYIAESTTNHRTSTWASDMNTPVTMSTGTWYHTVIQYDGSTWTYIRDGNYQDSATLTTGAGNYDFSIGARNGYTSYANMYIDELVIYDRILSGSEIRKLYNNSNGYNPYTVSTPATILNNFSTVETGSYSFNNSVNIGTTRGIINSLTINITEGENSPFFFVSSFTTYGSNSAEVTATCGIYLDGVEDITDPRTITPDQYGNFKLMNVPSNFTLGEHTITTECERDGNANPNLDFTINNSQMTEFHLYNVLENETINYKSISNIGDLSVTTTDTLLYNFTFTTGNTTNTSNVPSIVVHEKLTYNFTGGQWIQSYLKNINTTETCATLTRNGGSGTTGSVGTTCVFENLEPNTEYTIGLYGYTHATLGTTGTLSNIIINAYEIQTNQTAVNGTTFNTALGNGVETTLSTITITNPVGGTYNVFLDAGISVGSAGTDVGYYYIKSTSQNGNTFYRTHNTNYGNVNAQAVFSATGTGTQTYELVGYCPSANCVNAYGDFTAYVTDAEEVSTGEFTVYAYNVWDNSSVNIFNVTIAGTTYQTTNGSVVVLGQDETELTITGSNYIASTVNHTDQTIDLNQSIYQSIINFNAYELKSENLLSNATFYIDNQINGTFYLSAGTYNVTCEVSEYYNKTQEITISAKDERTINITDLYNAIINFTFYNSYSNATVNASWVGTTLGDSKSGTHTTYSFGTLAGETWEFGALNSKYQNYETSFTTVNGENRKEFYMNESALWLSFSEETNITITSTNSTQSYTNISLYVHLDQFATGPITIGWGNNQVLEYYNDGTTLLRTNLLVESRTLDPSRNWKVYLDGDELQYARIILEQQNSSGDWQTVFGRLTNEEGDATLLTVGGDSYRVTITYENYAVQYVYPVVSGDTTTQLIELTSSNNYENVALLTNGTNPLTPGETYSFKYVCPSGSCLLEETWEIQNGSQTTSVTTERSGTTIIEWEHTIPSDATTSNMQVTTYAGQEFDWDFTVRQPSYVLSLSSIRTTFKTNPQLAIILILIGLMIIVPAVALGIKKEYAKYTFIPYFAIWSVFIPIVGIAVVVLFILQVIMPIVRKQMEN